MGRIFRITPTSWGSPLNSITTRRFRENRGAVPYHPASGMPGKPKLFKLVPTVHSDSQVRCLGKARKTCNFPSKRRINPYNVNSFASITTRPAWVWSAPQPMPQAASSDTPSPDPPTIENDRDVVLMQTVAAGDDRAMAEIVQRWQRPLINYFYRSVGSVQQAEDLSQILFVKLYKAAPRYEPTAGFSTYLFSIARRLLINEYRRAQRKPLEPVDPADLNASVSGRRELEAMEIEEAFQAALAELPDNHRDALLLYKQQEMSYQEIAETLETTESSVKTWIFRARQKLKSILKEQLLK